MHTRDSSLVTKAFGRRADAGLLVAYDSHQDALRFLSSTLSQANGVALLQGPTGSGKTTIVKEQLGWSSRDAAVALVNGAHLAPRQLITDMLSQFGVKTDSEHDHILLQQLNDYLTQQTRSKRSPLLIVDNADRATPSALRQINWLAALDERGKYGLRIVLTGKERLSSLLRHDSMRSLARRHPATYSLNPMTSQETMIYLRTRLIAAGGERIEKVFSFEVCDRLHELSRGWPGLLNECAIKAMERMEELQSARPIPRIIITSKGRTIAEHELTEREYVIGRTDLADIVVKDRHVSKLHAMLKVYGNAIMLLDLNSTNGTTVNSTVVQKSILRNNDIIMLGQHRLKIENVPVISAEMDERISVTDTIAMQSIDDLRNLRARRTITTLKHNHPS
jgi:type II secretory pathway predicted ATPase ExeA